MTSWNDEQPASLVVFAMIFRISYYYGEDGPDMVGEQDVGEFGELSGFQWGQVKWRRFDRQSIIWFESKTAAMGAFFNYCI